MEIAKYTRSYSLMESQDAQDNVWNELDARIKRNSQNHEAI